MSKLPTAVALAFLATTATACAFEDDLGDFEPPFTNGGEPPASMNSPSDPGKKDPSTGAGAGKEDRKETPPTSPPSTSPNAPSCNRTKAFAAPLPALGLPSNVHLATPRLSADELTIFFTAHVNGVAKLHQAMRSSTSDPFGAPTSLAAQTSSAKDNDPSISGDGLSLWFSSERNSGTGDDLFFATRAAPNVPFGAPTLVPIVNTSGDEQHPYFRSSASELWFSSSRTGTWAIYTARRAVTGWEPARLVTELQSSSPTRQPMITEDGLTIIFASERDGGRGKRDIWQAQRPTVASQFTTPTPITEINSSANEFAGWLSADGCRLYFSSDRQVTDQHRIFVATRPQ